MKTKTITIVESNDLIKLAIMLFIIFMGVIQAFLLDPNKVNPISHVNIVILNIAVFIFGGTAIVALIPETRLVKKTVVVKST